MEYEHPETIDVALVRLMAFIHAGGLLLIHFVATMGRTFAPKLVIAAS